MWAKVTEFVQKEGENEGIKAVKWLHTNAEMEFLFLFDDFERC